MILEKVLGLGVHLIFTEALLLIIVKVIHFFEIHILCFLIQFLRKWMVCANAHVFHIYEKNKHSHGFIIYVAF